MKRTREYVILVAETTPGGNGFQVAGCVANTRAGERWIKAHGLHDERYRVAAFTTPWLRCQIEQRSVRRLTPLPTPKKEAGCRKTSSAK